jgi:fatty acid-binding protein DegV
MSVRTVAICTDSSSLLADSAAASLGVDVVPIGIALDGEPFDERMSSLDWFYERVRTGAVATTSQATPADFAAAYERAAAREAKTVVSIHLDARVSGTIASAEAAARAAPLPVTVVDTKTVSFGVGLCVRAAAEAAASGGLSADVVLAASRFGASLQNAFVARGGPGGRVPPSTAWTLLRYDDGAARRVIDCYSHAECVERLASLVLLDDGPLGAAVGHAGRETELVAGELAGRLQREERVASVERYRVGASIGAHTGPDSFGLFWWPLV